MKKTINLIGQRFGNLTVINQDNDYVSPKGCHKKQWLCRCDCGNEKVLIGNNLTRGKVRSCGCLTSRFLSQLRKKYNIYDLSGEHGIGYTSNTNKIFYFDLEDYDKIKDYCWIENDNGYIISFIHLNRHKIKSIRLHRLILDVAEELQVDHMNGVLYDNRKSQLRVCSCKQNSMNLKKSKNNTSGVKGVYWSKNESKWYASINYNCIKVHLGYFDKKEDAAQVRKEAEIKYFGQFNRNENYL